MPHARSRRPVQDARGSRTAELSPAFWRGLEARCHHAATQLMTVKRLAWQAPWCLRAKSGDVTLREVPRPTPTPTAPAA